MSYLALFNESQFDAINVTLNGLSANSLIYSDANNNLASVTIGTGINFSSGTLSTVANVLSITGTANQILANGLTTAQTGAVTLSLPQNIHTTATPTFGGLTLGTLSGVLKASAGVISGSATTDDLTEGKTNLYFTNSRAQSAMSGLYEPYITAGTTSQYWRGDKTWQTLNQAAVAGLTTTSDVTHNSLTLSGLIANSIIGVDGTKKIKSIALSGLTFDGNTLIAASSGVSSITGTANQILANGLLTAQTGAVTLSLPQNIHTTATPTFGGLTLGALSGVLKASAGVISGSATTDDLAEGKTNLYFTNARAQSAMSGLYETPITAGTTSQYWRGDKTWQTLNQAAISGLLTTDSPTFDKLTVTKGIVLTGTGSTGSIAITTNSITAINTAGLKNIYIGSYGCGNNSITGNSNILMGYYSGTAITSGSSNILIGNNNLYTMTDGNTNYIVGSNGQTTNNSIHHTCQFGSSGNAGNNCVNFGHHANNLGTGDFNTAVGQWTLKYQTSGSNNTTLGCYAAYGGATAASNSNTYIGAQSGYALAGANYNTTVGAYSLYSCSTGSNNTALGYYAGRQCGTGSNNVFIGYQAAYNDLNPSNKLYISNSSTSTPLIYGDFSTAVLTVNNNIIVSGLTASSLIATDANKQLTSTISGLSPTMTGLNLSSLTASRVVSTDGSKNITSIAADGTYPDYQFVRGNATLDWIPVKTIISNTFGSPWSPPYTVNLTANDTAAFSHLKIVCLIHSTYVTGTDTFFIRFNGVSTGTPYNWTNGTTTSGAAVNQIQCGTVYGTTGGNYNTNPAVFEFIIPNFGQTTYKKCLSGSYMMIGVWGDTGANNVLISGFWNSTAAITSITFHLTNGNFSTGSTISVYGIK